MELPSFEEFLQTLDYSELGKIENEKLEISNKFGFYEHKDISIISGFITLKLLREYHQWIAQKLNL